MRRLIVVLFLLLAACSDSPTDPPPVLDATGVWLVRAEAGSCELYMRAVVTEGTSEAFTGYGGLQFSKRGVGNTDPHVLFEGSVDGLHITTVYRQVGAPFQVNPFELEADERDEEGMYGDWSCDGASGEWAMERETH